MRESRYMSNRGRERERKKEIEEIKIDRKRVGLRIRRRGSEGVKGQEKREREK